MPDLRIYFAFLVVASCFIHVPAISEYSTNAICTQSNCLNPVFPALQDLSALQARTWQCQGLSDARQYMQFCRDAVTYDIAIPSPEEQVPLESVIGAQDDAASTAYFLHLSAMNIEAWEHSQPWDEQADACVKSVWHMACLTQFPRAEAGCNSGEQSTYLKPCKNVCQQYVQACNVNCCDESVQCVFDDANEPASLLGNAGDIQSGYADELGPSASCTGSRSGASRSGAPALSMLGGLVLFFAAGMGNDLQELVQSLPKRRMFLMSLLLFTAISLEGCGEAHMAPAWEDKPSYLLNFEFVRPGLSDVNATLNSCEDDSLPAAMKCNNHGRCVEWNTGPAFTIPGTVVAPITFCQCDMYWADPECRTPRKSQAVSWLLSLFFGYLGVDRWYLGEPVTAALKLATLGGCGGWWLYDIARLGSGPTYTYASYRVAQDLPHWVYVLCTLAFFCLLGFVMFTYVLAEYIKKKQNSKLLHDAEQSFKKSRSATLLEDPMDMVGMPTIASHGMPAAVPHYGATSLHAAKTLGNDNPFSAYAAYQNSLVRSDYQWPNKYDARCQPAANQMKKWLEGKDDEKHHDKHHDKKHHEKKHHNKKHEAMASAVPSNLASFDKDGA